MANPPMAASDAEERVRRVELVISTILRVGVIASLVVIVTGTIMSFIHHPAYLSSPGELLRLASSDAGFPHSIAAVVTGIVAGSGRAVVMLGMLMLIATPVVRVLVSIFTFIYQGDRIYIIITAFVFMMLVISFLLGNVGG